MEENEEKEPRRGPIASAMARAVSVGVNTLGGTFTELSHDAAISLFRQSAPPGNALISAASINF